MRRIILITVFALVGPGIVAAQNKSVYSSTKTKACKTIKQSSEGAGYYVGECPGTGGYKFQLLEDDIRQSINIITPAKKKFELDLWGFYGGFSSVGEKIEWRTKRGVPVALIARYNVAENDDPRGNRSVLIVSKIGKSSSCVVDIIEAGPKQNEKARISADAAPGMPCRKAN